MILVRYPENPILQPDTTTTWDNFAVFNPSVTKVGDKYFMLYRAMGDETDIDGKKFRVSRIGVCESDDGVNFSKRRLFIEPQYEWEKYGCEDARVTTVDGVSYIFYTALADYPHSPLGIKVGMAITKDFATIEDRRLVTPFNSKAMVMFPEKVEGKYMAMLTVNTDLPPSKIAVAKFDSIEQIWDQTYWRDWYRELSEHVVPLQRMKHDHVEVGAQPVMTEDGWLLVYAYIKDYGSDSMEFRVEAALLDKSDPTKVIGLIERPLLKPETEYELKGQINNVVFPTSARIEQDTLGVFYGAADSTCCLATAPMIEVRRDIRKHKFGIAKLKRVGGPIITPESSHPWEAKATFNPAAIWLDDRVHLLYRAMSLDNTSVLGYASSRNGINVDVRLDNPVYTPKIDQEMKKVPNGNSGCEDPRLVAIGEKIYMTYTAFNGMDSPRVALSSILVEDFLANRWNWEMPKLISDPNKDNKNACILPEKVNGKYVFFHRLENTIHIDYVDDIESLANEYLQGQYEIPVRTESWDAVRIGISAPPIKTDKGWLLLYHGISRTHHEYRVGAMLLDLLDPAKVLARTPYALLEPETDYEINGQVNNVVFPCGAARLNEDLYVYYGGGDRVVGVAAIKFDELLNYLEELKDPKFVV
jgi:beta-1,2-mannobiose phosphorylase / 1,2-beta-oligomannan phosphorylase